MPAVNWWYVDWSDGSFPAIRPWVEGEEQFTRDEAVREVQSVCEQRIAHWSAIRADIKNVPQK